MTYRVLVTSIKQYIKKKQKTRVLAVAALDVMPRSESRTVTTLAANVARFFVILI